MLSEIVYIIESPKYIVEDFFCTTFYVEIMCLLIQDRESMKYNFYIIDYAFIQQVGYPPEVEKVVEIFDPVDIEIARQNYPDYNFTDENYGFIPL
jgi:hypothetical protein